MEEKLNIYLIYINLFDEWRAQFSPHHGWEAAAGAGRALTAAQDRRHHGAKNLAIAHVGASRDCAIVVEQL